MLDYQSMILMGCKEWMWRIQNSAWFFRSLLVDLGEGYCLQCDNKKLRQQIKELQTKANQAKEANDVQNEKYLCHEKVSCHPAQFPLSIMTFDRY